MMMMRKAMTFENMVVFIFPIYFSLVEYVCRFLGTVAVAIFSRFLAGEAI